MIKLGIFLLPDAKLKKLINNNKIQIIRIFGNQKYVSHLPHCTICVLDVSEKIMKVKKLKRERISKKCIKRRSFKRKKRISSK